METLYRVPFAVLECPNIKLKRPSWVHMPSAMTVYALVVVSYFLITGGNSIEMGRLERRERDKGTRRLTDLSSLRPDVWLVHPDPLLSAPAPSVVMAL